MPRKTFLQMLPIDNAMTYHAKSMPYVFKTTATTKAISSSTTMLKFIMMNNLN